MRTPRPPRGYVYPLAPVLSVRAWELDAALVEVARVRAEIAQCTRRHEAIGEQIATEAARSRQAWMRRADPLGRGMLLDFLVDAQRRRAEAQEQIDELQSRLADALEHAEIKRLRLEVVQRHRDDASSAHWTDASQRDQRLADDAWNIRGYGPAPAKEIP